jgi:hypothetical protein
VSVNSEALTLVLSRRLAIADGRNQQQAMIHTARVLRNETHSRDTYESLGIFLTATPAERQKILDVSEGMFLSC